MPMIRAEANVLDRRIDVCRQLDAELPKRCGKCHVMRLSLSRFLLAGKLCIQPRPGHFPVAFGCLLRNSEDFRCFFEAQSAEVAQLHDAALTAVDFSQATQCAIQYGHFDAALLYLEHRVIEWDEHRISAALSAPPSARMVHQYTADQVCGEREEMRSILALDFAGSNQLYVDLVSQCSGFQALEGSPAEVASCDPPEFRIHKG